MRYDHEVDHEVAIDFDLFEAELETDCGLNVLVEFRFLGIYCDTSMQLMMEDLPTAWSPRKTILYLRRGGMVPLERFRLLMLVVIVNIIKENVGWREGEYMGKEVAKGRKREGGVGVEK